MVNTATIEAVATAVHDLSDAVEKMQAGLVDRSTVETIASDVLERQRAAAEDLNVRNGVRAEDTDAEPAFLRARTPLERLVALHQRPAEQVAPLAKRSVSDVQAFQDRADELLVLSYALGSPGNPRDPRELGFYSQEFVPAFQAAMDSTTAGEGDEWVPTELSSTFIDRINLPLMVASLFPLINMPTQPFDLPAAGVTRRRTGVHAEQTADSGQTKFKAVTPATRKVTLSAVKFAGRILVSREAEEDSMVAMLPFIMREIQDYLAADLDDATLNGDLTGTHMDSDVTDSDDVRKFWNGLRDIALNQLTGTDRSGADAALAVSTLRANRKLMGKYGVRPTDLAHIVSMAGYIDLLADSSVLTMEKYGPAATIVAGELAKVDGSPVIVSEYMSDYQNASGVIDGVTQTQTSALTVNRRGFIRGQRRGMTMETLRELYAEADQDAVIASVRQDFKQLYSNTENVAALTYNLPGSA